MRALVQTPKATPQITPAKAAIPGRAPFGQGGEMSLLEPNPIDVEGRSRITKVTRFGHDLSRIPVHARVPVKTQIKLTVNTGMQTKLTVNTPGDMYEQEADRIAEQVMRRPEPLFQRAVSGTPLRIQRFTGQPTRQMEAAPASVNQVLARPGRPLEPALRQDMQQRFGHDFSRVRVHSDAAAEQSARDVNANAYTVGQDIVFGASQFAPGTSEGRRLLAHELTHVVQQLSGVGGDIGQGNEQRGPSPTFLRAAFIQRAPRTASSADELQSEIKSLLDQTQERYNHYVTMLRPSHPHAADLGRAAAKHLQEDFVSIFGEGVKEARYSLHGSDHRIDLFLHDYNLGIELKLSGKASSVQRRVFIDRAWGSKGAQHTLAYVGADGWWAGAGGRLPAAKIRKLRTQIASLEKRALVRAASGAHAGSRRAKNANKSSKGKRSDNVIKNARRGQGVAGSIGKAFGLLDVLDVAENIKALDFVAAGKSAFNLTRVGTLINLVRAILGGEDSEKSEERRTTVEPPPRNQPLPGGHYFIPMSDGREIEVDGYALLNNGSVQPIYPDEKFPGEAQQEWLQNRRFRIHFETPEDE